MATMTVAEWRQLYRELLTCAPMEAAEQLLESAVEEATEQAAPETSLARIGRILSVDVKQINALAPTGRMTMLVLQTVCRLLRACKKQTKALKKELYVLLDRLALLLDAANPPSLGEEDDRSPFQQFLQHVIGLRLQRFLPVLLKEVNVRYELEDAEEEDASPLKAISAKVATPIAEPSPSPAPTGAATKSSILSALQDEKRPVKRRRTEADDRFREVLLPDQFRKRKPNATFDKRSHKRTSMGTTGAPASTVPAHPTAARKSLSSAFDKVEPSAASATTPVRPPPPPPAGRRSLSGPAPGSSRGPVLPRRSSGGPELLSNSIRVRKVISPAQPAPPRGSTSLVIAKTPDRPVRMPARTLAAQAAAASSMVIKGTPDRPVNSTNRLLRSASTGGVLQNPLMRTPDRPKRATTDGARTTGSRAGTRLLVLSSPPLHQNRPAPRLRHPPAPPSALQ